MLWAWTQRGHHCPVQVRERLRMALERVAVLEEQLELSNQEVRLWPTAEAASLREG